MSESARDQALKVALLQRSAHWKAATARAQRLSCARAVDLADAAQMADDYRLLAHDLARVRRLLPDTRTREYLEAAYARAHGTLYRGARRPGIALLTLFRDEIPAVVRWLRPHIVWAARIFILTAFAGYWMVHTYPDLIGLFASPDLIATVERGQLWTEGILNIVPSAVLSLQILTNNIVVSLFAYCAGFAFGLGTLYILGLNGLMLGAVFAFTGLHGIGAALLRFIVPHGCVELSVMCLSGAAGAAVGEALIRPSHGSRMESFRVAALRSGRLLIACALLLAGSGIIEGYISPRAWFPTWARVCIGMGYWLVMIALLKGWLFPRSKRVSSAAAPHTAPTAFFPTSPRTPRSPQRPAASAATAARPGAPRAPVRRGRPTDRSIREPH
ncbi:MAG: stage II sporulation protein M [Steroidobacteraceae bacterium]